MKIFSSRPWLKAFSALFINFSAGYFALIFITPNVSSVSFPLLVLLLTSNACGGIVFLVASAKIEERLEKL